MKRPQCAICLLLGFLVLLGACGTGGNDGEKENTVKTDTAKSEKDTLSQLEKRIKSLSKKLDGDPDQPKLQYQLAKAYSQEGNYLQARRTINKALSLDSANAKYHHLSGKIYWELDAAKQAINQTKRALDFDPDMKKPT